MGNNKPVTRFNLPAAQRAVLRDIEAKRDVVESGNGYELILCVGWCALYRIAMPVWLATEFLGRTHAVFDERSASWDDAFGRPYPKGVHLSAMRKARKTRFAVFEAVQAARKRDPRIAIDDRLFEAVGGPLKIGKTLAGGCTTKRNGCSTRRNSHFREVYGILRGGIRRLARIYFGHRLQRRCR